MIHYGKCAVVSTNRENGKVRKTFRQEREREKRDEISTQEYQLERERERERKK